MYLFLGCWPFQGVDAPGTRGASSGWQSAAPGTVGLRGFGWKVGGLGIGDGVVRGRVCGGCN